MAKKSLALKYFSLMAKKSLALKCFSLMAKKSLAIVTRLKAIYIN